MLLAEFILNPPSSFRSTSAIARINFLHRRHRISNDDMLFTLAMFASVPIDFVNAHEWRGLTTTELHALAVFWKYVGDAMNISYEQLPSAACGWHDGLHWLQELRTWSTAYDERYTLPAENSRLMGSRRFDQLQQSAPPWLEPIVRNTLLSLLDERLKRALGFVQVIRLSSDG